MEKPNEELVEGTSGLRVRVLGDVRVDRQGARIPLGGARRTAVLAFLALRAPHVVSRQGLVGAVWGDHPPASADNAVQVHVSALRKVLGRSAIVTSSDGYHLDPAVSVDLHDFECAVSRGAASLADGDREAASDAWSEALSTWAGPAFHGVREAAFAADERDRLDVVRLEVLQRRVEVDLMLGRHHRVIAELLTTVAAHPFHEDLRCLLMESLYRCGRQAEALQVYEQGRQILRDELGVDPSPTLTRAQQRVLRQIAEETHPAVAAEGSPVMPGSLPALPNRTVGRDDTIAAIASALLASAGARLLTLVGPGGVGKTRLALEVARMAGHDFRDGAVFVPLAQAERPDDVAVIACQALGINAGVDAPRSLASALTTRQMLIVWDNFEHVVDAAELLHDLLAGTVGSRFLVTSRQALRIQAERRFPVTPLPVGSLSTAAGAIGLFVDRARAINPTYSPGAEELESIAAVVARCDGLPLAVELAAAHVDALGAAKLAEELATSSDVLRRTGRGYPARQQSLRESIAWSLGAVSQEDADFLRAMTVFRGGFTLEHAGLVARVDTMTALARVESLRDCSLVQQGPAGGGPPRFFLLETVRHHADQQLDPAMRRLLAARHAQACRRLLDPPQYPARLPLRIDDARPWMSERSNLRQAVRWAREAGESTLLAELVIGLFGMWASNGPLDEITGWLTAVARDPDVGEGRRCDALYDVAILEYRRRGPRAAASVLGEALVTAERLNDHRRLMHLLCFAAFLHGADGRGAAALADLARARALAAELRDGECGMLVDEAVGLVQDWMGQPVEAAEWYERALAYARPKRLARTSSLLNNVTEAYLQYSPERALETAAEGLALAELMDERETHTDLLAARGFAHLKLGHHGRASRDLSRALRALVTQGALADALDTLPRLTAALAPQHPARAAELLGAYRAAATDEGDSSHREAMRLAHLGDVIQRLGTTHPAYIERGARLVAREGRGEALLHLSAIPPE